MTRPFPSLVLPSLCGLGLLVFAVTAVASEQQAEPPAAAFSGDIATVVNDASVQENRVICGQNATYMLLKLKGKSLEFQDIKRTMKLSEQGVTVLQIKQACLRHGLDVRVKHIAPDQIHRTNLPLIAHFHEPLSTSSPIQHFVVVLNVSGDEVVYLDGTSGKTISITKSKFMALSSGYIVEPVGISTRFWVLLALAGLVPLGIGCRRYGARLHASLTRATLVLVAVICWNVDPRAGNANEPPDTAAATVDRPIDGGIWRSHAHDAINAADLYLSISGRSVDRNQLRALEGSGVSMLMMRDVLNQLGEDLVVAKCTPDQLKEVRFPAITMLQDKTGANTFGLILSVDKDVKVGLVAMANIESLQHDDFRRQWSGYILSPRSHQPTFRAWLVFSVICFCYAGIRLRPFLPN